MERGGKLITLAIHTYEKANILKSLLEREGIEVALHDVDLSSPEVSSGVRVRIHESDLPLALQTMEAAMGPMAESERAARKQVVLIPVDFSDYSKRACSIGFDFASHAGCEVVLLHSYFNEEYSGLLPFGSDQYKLSDVRQRNSSLEAEARRGMTDFASTLHDDMNAGLLPKVTFSVTVLEGLPENAILDFSRQLKPRLVVMGTRSRSRDEALGSVTAEVLDAGKFPVLAVPESYNINSIRGIRNVAFLSILSQQDMLSFDLFARMMSDLPLNVTIVPIDDKRNHGHIDESGRSLMGYCQRRYSHYAFEWKSIEEKNFISDLDSYIKQAKINLVLIPNKKKNIFTRLFAPSVAHKLIFSTDTLMLVVPV